MDIHKKLNTINKIEVNGRELFLSSAIKLHHECDLFGSFWYCKNAISSELPGASPLNSHDGSSLDPLRGSKRPQPAAAFGNDLRSLHNAPLAK